MARNPKKLNQLKVARIKRLVSLSASQEQPSDPQTLRQEVLHEYLACKKHPNLLILDVDGTIVNFRTKSWQDVVPRPYLFTFLRKVSRCYDIIIMSRNHSEHVELIRRLYLGRFVKLAMSRNHLLSKLKCVEFLKDFCSNIVILDDNIDCVPTSDRHLVMKIKKWTRNHKRDKELLQAADVLVSKAQDKT